MVPAFRLADHQSHCSAIRVSVSLVSLVKQSACLLPASPILRRLAREVKPNLPPPSLADVVLRFGFLALNFFFFCGTSHLVHRKRISFFSSVLPPFPHSHSLWFHSPLHDTPPLLPVEPGRSDPKQSDVSVSILSRIRDHQLSFRLICLQCCAQ